MSKRTSVSYTHLDVYKRQAWLSCCREATLFRESDLVGEQKRLRSTIYQECYQPFEVYDSLQYGIVCNGQPLGALSLFRCREDGPF